MARTSTRRPLHRRVARNQRQRRVRAAGFNLAGSFHHRFKNDSELFVNYGTPAAPTTLQRVALKYVLRTGGGAGTQPFEYAVIANEPIPPAPWRLNGWATMTLQPVDLGAARRAVPPELLPVAVWPGRTVGGLYLASYQAGSTLAYHELIVVAAFARNGGRIGAWIPLIYVDDARSLAGGRAIWALPKEPASFEVEENGGYRVVRVRQGATVLCEVASDARTPAVPLPFALPLPGFGNAGGAARFFVGRMRGSVAAARADVRIPHGSPLAAYGLDRPRAAFAWANLQLVVPAPAGPR